MSIHTTWCLCVILSCFQPFQSDTVCRRLELHCNTLCWVHCAKLIQWRWVLPCGSLAFSLKLMRLPQQIFCIKSVPCSCICSRDYELLCLQGCSWLPAQEEHCPIGCTITLTSTCS